MSASTTRGGLLHRLASRLASRLKGGEAYRLDPDMSPRMLADVTARRGFAALRGLRFRLRFGAGRGLIFAGHNVRIHHAYQIRAGRSLILEDGVYIDALSRQGVHFGNNVTIAKYAIIQVTGVAQNLGAGLRLGNHVGLGAFNFIGAQGGVSIGDNVICGPRVSFHAENHVYSDPDTPIRLQGVTRRGIVVEDDCWIGAGAMVLDGVRIGKGTVVAAGAIVTRDVPPYSVVAGVPARVIKSRRPEQPGALSEKDLTTTPEF